MEIKQIWRFGDDVIDLNEVAAMVNQKVYLCDGREMCVGDATADALRKAIPSYPEPQKGTCDKAPKASRNSSSLPSVSGARASKARARLPRHSS